jgi:FAD:protein FMN transferase
VRPFSRGIKALDSTHEGVLGTRLSLSVRGTKASELRQVERQLLSEIDRLEAIFSVYRADSELSRWKTEPGIAAAPVSVELRALLTLGLNWHERSDGIFNPCVGALSDRWRHASETQVLPTSVETQSLAEGVAEMPYRFDDGQLQRTGNCSWLNFNALAKGLLIDLATASSLHDVSPSSVVVNVGGDLVHRGAGSAAVRVEDPFRPYDNAAPLDIVFVSNAGVATSGSSKRGVRIGDTWFSHIIDPRTGWPVDRVMSATVVASDAATADAIATVVSVLQPSEGIAFVESLDMDIACTVVGCDRSVLTNARWNALRRA